MFQSNLRQKDNSANKMDDFISVVSGMSTLEFPYLLSIKKIPTLIFCIF